VVVFLRCLVLELEEAFVKLFSVSPADARAWFILVNESSKNISVLTWLQNIICRGASGKAACHREKLATMRESAQKAGNVPLKQPLMVLLACIAPWKAWLRLKSLRTLSCGSLRLIFVCDEKKYFALIEREVFALSLPLAYLFALFCCYLCA
jgi:hypothetical protein